MSRAQSRLRALQEGADNYTRPAPDQNFNRMPGTPALFPPPDVLPRPIRPPPAGAGEAPRFDIDYERLADAVALRLEKALLPGIDAMRFVDMQLFPFVVLPGVDFVVLRRPVTTRAYLFVANYHSTGNITLAFDRRASNGDLVLFPRGGAFEWLYTIPQNDVHLTTGEGGGAPGVCIYAEIDPRVAARNKLSRKPGDRPAPYSSVPEGVIEQAAQWWEGHPPPVSGLASADMGIPEPETNLSPEELRSLVTAGYLPPSATPQAPTGPIVSHIATGEPAPTAIRDTLPPGASVPAQGYFDPVTYARQFERWHSGVDIGYGQGTPGTGIIGSGGQVLGPRVGDTGSTALPGTTLAPRLSGYRRRIKLRG